MSTAYNYLEIVMKQLSNIVYNSESPTVKKEDIVRSLKCICEDFEQASGKKVL